MPVIPSLESLRQDNHKLRLVWVHNEFQANLVYIMKLFQKTNQRNKQQIVASELMLFRFLSFLGSLALGKAAAVRSSHEDSLGDEELRAF